MKIEQTLRDFILKNDLDPEDGGLGLDWFRPDSAMFLETEKWDDDEVHIFEDRETGVRCAILDTNTTSELWGEDRLNEWEETGE